MKAPDIAHMLAGRIDRLVGDLLPAGHREGHEWRCGSIAGEPGDSLGVHLTGDKAGVWGDFSTDRKGDALDLVAAVHGFSISEAINWSRQWLGQDHPGAEPTTNVTAVTKCRSQANDRWCEPWRRARPITK